MVKRKNKNGDSDSHRTHQQKHGKSRYGGRGIRSSCCCPCLGVSSMVKGIGRCLFVSCYPVIQCFGLDERRHQHHHHRHFY